MVVLSSIGFLLYDVGHLGKVEMTYGMSEVRYPNICREIQFKVINIFLNDIYTTRGYYIQRSMILVRKKKLLEVLE